MERAALVCGSLFWFYNKLRCVGCEREINGWMWMSVAAGALSKLCYTIANLLYTTANRFYTILNFSYTST